MKIKILSIILILILFISCSDDINYHFFITRINGTKDQLTIHSRNSFIRPVLENGCIKWYGSEYSVTCGVQDFTFYKTKYNN